MTKIDIFSGFLGAGKTTLIRKLIAEGYKGEKLVLIENEFGEIGIDGGFLKESGIQINELNAGCICCSLVGDFRAALQQVVEQYHPDRIVIEPSGVGKLSDVTRAVEGVAEHLDVQLNSFVTVADVNKVKMYMKNFGEFYDDQISHASCILLSRTQTASEEKIAAAVAMLREKNPTATIVTTAWDELTGEQILKAMSTKDDFKAELIAMAAKANEKHAEEDEEEEETDQLQLSDENKKILEEMDKGGKNKKGKKQKKPKKEKQPKPKKPAKEKKKKEKPEKEDKPSVSEKKLSPKKILPIVVVCISLGAVILLLGNFLADYTAKRSGREAYYAGDYQTCYQNLMGKELDETEQVMYSQSESILTIRMWLREYEVFVNEGSELEALDSLLQAVRDYPTLLNYATQWNAQDEVSLAFQDILNILSQKYQLSQEEAQQIADISDNVEYTKNVMLVLQRLGLGFWEFPQGTVTEETSAPNTEETPAQLPDPLPEEKEIQQ